MCKRPTKHSRIFRLRKAGRVPCIFMMCSTLLAGCSHVKKERKGGDGAIGGESVLIEEQGDGDKEVIVVQSADEGERGEEAGVVIAAPTGVTGNGTLVMDSDQKIIGYVERFRIMPDNVLVESRMDSGATTSSVNAMNQTLFERDGRRWVRFEVQNEANGENVVLERPIVKTVQIRQHTGEPDERYVVELEIYLGEDHLKGEFTLANRSNFTYKGLLGRNLLRHGFLIDSNETGLLGVPRE